MCLWSPPPTLELSSVLSGFSPPLQISHRVVPKPHLSVAKLRFWGFSMHSGGTQGMRSTRTERERERRSQTHARPRAEHLLAPPLTFPGQHAHADAWVAELDEGGAPRRPVLLSDQQHVLGADVSVDEVLVLLRGREGRVYSSGTSSSSSSSSLPPQAAALPGSAWPRTAAWPPPASR